MLEKCGVQPDRSRRTKRERQLTAIPKVTGQPTGQFISPVLNQVFEARL